MQVGERIPFNIRQFLKIIWKCKEAKVLGQSGVYPAAPRQIQPRVDQGELVDRWPVPFFARTAQSITMATKKCLPCLCVPVRARINQYRQG